MVLLYHLMLLFLVSEIKVKQKYHMFYCTRERPIEEINL